MLPGMNDHHTAAAAAAAGVTGGVLGKHHLMSNAGNPAVNLHSLQQQQQHQRNILSGNGGMDIPTSTGNPGGLMSAYLTDDGRPPPPPHSSSLMHQQHNQSGRKSMRFFLSLFSILVFSLLLNAFNERNDVLVFFLFLFFLILLKLFMILVLTNFL